MRILQVVHQYPPYKVGGTEIYAQNLSRALKARGHHVIVFHRGEPSLKRGVEASLDAQGVKVYAYREKVPPNPLRLFARSFRNPFMERSFAELILKEDPEVIHFQHLKDLSAALVSLAGKRGIPIVLSLHDYWFLCPNAQLLRWRDGTICEGPKLWLNCAYLCAAYRVGFSPILFPGPLVALLFAYRDRILRKALFMADLVVCPSEFVRSIFMKQGLPEGRVCTLENGIELSKGQILRKKEEKERVHFLYLGAIAWQKGVHILIEAFNRLGPAEATLTICGDETAFPDYTRKLREMASDSIIFQGAVGRSKMWATLASADVLILPSLWYEVSPLVIQEAFAAGVPVIASRIGALEEKVRHGVDGLLFPPGDATALCNLLRGLMANPSTLEGLRRNIRPVKTAMESAKEMEALYERYVLKGRNSDRGG